MTVVQGLWVGANISRIEQISIASFLANGCDYHLYTYAREPLDLPAGTRQMDARDILPEEAIWAHRFGEETGSLAGFSDAFRFTLLAERGGIWVDADLICLRPLPHDLPEICIATEAGNSDDSRMTSTQFLKTPPGDALMRACAAACAATDPASVRFLEVGPQLIDRLTRELGYERHCLPHVFANPMPWWQFYRPMLAEHGAAMAEELNRPGVVCLHLFHEMIRRTGVAKFAHVHPDAMLERLARRYGIPPSADPRAEAEGRKLRAHMLATEAGRPVRQAGESKTDDVARLHRAIEVDPSVADAYILLAGFAEDGAALDDVLSRLEKVPAVRSTAAVRVALSRAMAQVGQTENGLIELMQAIRASLAGGEPSVAAEALMFSVQQGWQQRLRPLLAETPGPDSAPPILASALGRYHLSIEDYRLAHDYSLAAIKANPRVRDAHTYLTASLIARGEFDSAVIVAEKAARIDGMAWSWVLLAEVMEQVGNGQLAVEAAREAMARQPVPTIAKRAARIIANAKETFPLSPRSDGHCSAGNSRVTKTQDNGRPAARAPVEGDRGCAVGANTRVPRMSGQDQTCVLFGVHIPKCAGTSLLEEFQQHLDPNEIWQGTSLFRNFIDYRRDFMDAIEDHRLKVVWGHQLHEQMLRLIPNPYLLTGLRDPGARLVSQYNFGVRLASAQGQDFPAFEEWICLQRNPICNFLIKRFPTLAEGGEKSAFGKARRILECFDHVYFTETFGDCVEGLRGILGKPITESHKNVSESPTDGKAIAPELMEQDQALVDWARATFPAEMPSEPRERPERLKAWIEAEADRNLLQDFLFSIEASELKDFGVLDRAMRRFERHQHEAAKRLAIYQQVMNREG